MARRKKVKEDFRIPTDAQYASVLSKQPNFVKVKRISRK